LPVNRYCKIVVLSLCNSVQVTKLCRNSVLCHVPIVPTVAIISNAVARWRAMHVSRLQNVRCIHWTHNSRCYEMFLVQLKKLKLCLGVKHKIGGWNNVQSSKTLFHSPDGVVTCSGLHPATCRWFLSSAMNSGTMRTLMKDFRYYSMKLKLSIIEWYRY